MRQVGCATLVREKRKTTGKRKRKNMPPPENPSSNPRYWKNYGGEVAMLDDMENVPFASIGGHPVSSPIKIPTYVDWRWSPEWLGGYLDFYDGIRQSRPITPDPCEE